MGLFINDNVTPNNVLSQLNKESLTITDEAKPTLLLDLPKIH